MISQEKIVQTFITTIINASSSCTMAVQETLPCSTFPAESALPMTAFNAGPLSSLFSPLAQVSLTRKIITELLEFKK